MCDFDQGGIHLASIKCMLLNAICHAYIILLLAKNFISEFCRPLCPG